MDSKDLLVFEKDLQHFSEDQQILIIQKFIDLNLLNFVSDEVKKMAVEFNKKGKIKNFG